MQSCTICNIAFCISQSHYTASPATQHKWSSTLTQQVNWYSIYLPRKDGRLSWRRLPSSAPARSRTGDQTISRSRVRHPNHYTDIPAAYLFILYTPFFPHSLSIAAISNSVIITYLLIIWKQHKKTRQLNTGIKIHK